MSARDPNAMPLSAPARLEVAVLEAARTSFADAALLTSIQFGEPTRLEGMGLRIENRLEVLSGSGPFFQNWYTSDAITLGQHAAIRYAGNPQLVFGHLQLACTDPDTFRALVQQAYEEIYGCLQHTGCHHLLRTWGYFPGITDPVDHRLNRYDQFCSARLQAMQACGIENKIYPAATVIGSQDKFFQVYFLGADGPGIAVENPRQTSAYDYPTADSHAPPLFSRGVLKTWHNHTHFYVSGTASIVGHETQHADNVTAQLNESLNNVETLVVHANHLHGTQMNAQDDLLYMKVYVRYRRDVAHIKSVLDARLPAQTQRILLLGDMCRDDLLVEIEALYQS